MELYVQTEREDPEKRRGSSGRFSRRFRRLPEKSEQAQLAIANKIVYENTKRQNGVKDPEK